MRAAFAPDSEVFHSALLAAVERGQGAPRQATAAQWGGWLDGAQRRGEFRQSERDWLGLDHFIKGRGTVTREELAQYVRENQVRVQDVVLGNTDEMPVAAWWNDEGGANEETPWDDLSPAEQAAARDRYIDEVERYEEEGVAPKFASYQLPGGENYRELLLTLPTDATRLRVEGDRISRLENPTAEEIETFRRANTAGASEFCSSHFDQPNILAHVRFNERTDDDGKRVLFLEEIQSDWHQAGRKKGYARADTPDSEVLKLLEDAGYTASYNGTNWVVMSRDGGPVPNKLAGGSGPNQFAANLAQVAQMVLGRRDLRAALGAVPDAPFKSTDEWAMLAFKRMVRWAAENGFDRIGWTTGAQQAKRYALSKQVKSVEWDDFGTGKFVTITSNEGNYIEMKVSPTGEVGEGRGAGSGQFNGRQIEDVVGKDVAEKVMAGTKGKLTGAGLQVGGEGMCSFYDSILPNAVNKWAKKFGAAVGQATVPLSDEATYQRDLALLRELDSLPANPTRFATVHALDLTPAMREAALEGMPLFKRNGTAAGNTAEEEDERPAFRF